MKQQAMNVTQDKEAPTARPVLAKAIIEISTAMRKLLDSGLNEHAIVVLIADSTTVGRPDIRAVLYSLKNLAKEYCR